jgi:hypothetical protein
VPQLDESRGRVKQFDSFAGIRPIRQIPTRRMSCDLKRLIVEVHFVKFFELRLARLQHRKRVGFAQRLHVHLAKCIAEPWKRLSEIAELRRSARRDALDLALHDGGIEGVDPGTRPENRPGCSRDQQIGSEDDHVRALCKGGQRISQIPSEFHVLSGRRVCRLGLEHNDPLFSEKLRNGSIGDALRKGLDNRLLTRARLADEDRIPIPARGQDLDQRVDLDLSSHNLCEIAFSGLSCEIAERI